MATQDSGDFDFGKAALSILSGAAAGASTSNIGAGFGAGLASVEQRRERERQSVIQNRQLQQQDTLTQQRIESGELKLEEQRQGFQRRQDQQAVSGFEQELQMMSKLGEQNRIRYQKEYSSKATRPIETDGSITYGLDEDRTGLIDSHTRASKTLANVDSYVVSLERFLTSNNPAEKKAAERMQRILGAELGYKYVPAQDGHLEQIKTPHGTFPVEFASAAKIKGFATRDVEANRKNYEHHNRTRSETGYAAQRTMYRAMEEMPDLSSNEAAGIAQGYQNAVQGNDYLSRNLKAGHTMDRLLKDKDPNQRKAEMISLSNIFDKGNVDYVPDPNGDFLVDAESYNKWVTKYNRGDQKINVIDDTGFVRVDEEFVNKVFNRSGLNSLKEKWVGQARSMNSRNNLSKREAAGFKEEVATSEQFRKSGVGEKIKDTKIQRQAQSLSADLPIEETLQRHVLKTPEGNITLGTAAQRGVMVNAQNRIKARKETGPRKQFKARYGSDPEQFFSQPITDQNSVQVGKAQTWWDRRKFDPSKDKAAIDKEARVFMRELKKPSVFKEFQLALGNQEIESQAVEEFSQNTGQSFESQAKSTVSELIKRSQK